MDAKTVLVTGAGRGLGRAIALRLDAEGHALILHARAEENLAATQAELRHPERHAVLYADFSDIEALRGFTAALRREHGKSLFAVINNAGLTRDKPIAYQPEADIDVLLQVNLKAPIWIGKMAMKLFIARGEGVIINIGSVVGESGNAYQSVYAATKAGMRALAKSWAQEAAELSSDHKIRALCVAPGFMQTDMTNELSEDVREDYLRRIPARRLGRPEEVAGLIAFLLSDDASYLNGCEIKINGGLL